MPHFLPLDKKVKQIIFHRFLFLAALAGTFVWLCAVSFRRCDLLEKILVGIFSVLLYALIFWQSHVIRLLRDTTWEGEIIQKKVKHAANKSMNPRDMKSRLVCLWWIRKDDGTVVKLKMDVEELNENYFTIGERVRHTAGTRYPTKLVITDKNYLCPVCGHSTIRPRCPFCHTDYSMIVSDHKAEENGFDPSLFDAWGGDGA